MLYHLSYFGSYETPFKCYTCRWTGKRVIKSDEFLNLNQALNPLVTKYISFVSKTKPCKAHTTTNGSVVTGCFRERTPKIWGSFAQNFVYGHFQQPQWDAQGIFQNLICTVWKDWNFIYGVQVSYQLNSTILFFRLDSVPMSRQRLHSPSVSYKRAYLNISTCNFLEKIHRRNQVFQLWP